MRGSFFVTKSTGEKEATFIILNPKNKVKFSLKQKREGVFKFNATKEGRYSFIFNNKKTSSQLDITFAVNLKGDANVEDLIPDFKLKNAVMDHDLDDLTFNLTSVYRTLKELQAKQRFSVLRQDSHNDSKIFPLNVINYYIDVLQFS